ncbi:hypothetical protein [Deinococcus aquatilis]|uniref:hypothetical protein n=1 Tax=Deinococcus aquatilis TaxID=519440 RepID=UPI000373820B|nr:hypothetical protein [Deinococcus aquatilis]
MYRQLVILDAIRSLQARRPDASVLVGDLQDVLKQQGLKWGRDTLRTCLKYLVKRRRLKKLNRNVYRLLPSGTVCSPDPVPHDCP